MHCPINQDTWRWAWFLYCLGWQWWLPASTCWYSGSWQCKYQVNSILKNKKLFIQKIISGKWRTPEGTTMSFNQPRTKCWRWTAEWWLPMGNCLPVTRWCRKSRRWTIAWAFARAPAWAAPTPNCWAIPIIRITRTRTRTRTTGRNRLPPAFAWKGHQSDGGSLDAAVYVAGSPAWELLTTDNCWALTFKKTNNNNNNA